LDIYLYTPKPGVAKFAESLEGSSRCTALPGEQYTGAEGGGSRGGKCFPSNSLKKFCHSLNLLPLRFSLEEKGEDDDN
jgi:hypothetical protein